jgi:hypothetical protein
VSISLPTNKSSDICSVCAERALLEDVVGTKADKLWGEIGVPEDLGLECSKYKWRQNQSFVEVSSIHSRPR